MDNQYIGMIQAAGFNFIPRQFYSAQGGHVSISNDQALFSLLGTTFGGDGRVSFQLPDLRGTAPVGWGGSPSTSFFPRIGIQGGSAVQTLTQAHMPQHTHTATFNPIGGGASTPISVTIEATTAVGTSETPSTGAYLAQAKPPSGGKDQPELIYSSNPGDVVKLGGIEVSGGSGGITGGTVTNSATGQSNSFSMYQPSLAVNYLICSDGTYPSRN
ncbi:tail fiber protein [Vibrio wakamikoensis]|uniref:phage tail protein n=1 Tax=Vibrio wakamikoensis TaxID=2910251 RepID=UPI003D1E454E